LPADQSGPPELLQAARAASADARLLDGDIDMDTRETLRANKRQSASLTRARPSTRDLVDQTADLAGVSTWTADVVADAIRTGVTIALRRRSIAEENLQPPPAHILAAAVAAMPISNLRGEICSLIASAMDTTRARFVLPAYVEILRQLSRDEAELLRVLPPQGRFTPTADLVLQAKTGQVEFCIRHILPVGIAEACAVRENIPQYVDNLIRLGLLMRPPGHEADEAAYVALSKRAFLRNATKKTPKNARFSFDRSVLGLTDLGAGLKVACLD
jgi:hypothetical protein